jgi:hypothetical protein
VKTGLRTGLRIESSNEDCPTLDVTIVFIMLNDYLNFCWNFWINFYNIFNYYGKCGKIQMNPMSIELSKTI